jgi:hypothetical protein
MDKLATDTRGNTVDAGECQPAELIEHAHTRAEHTLRLPCETSWEQQVTRRIFA